MENLPDNKLTPEDKEFNLEEVIRWWEKKRSLFSLTIFITSVLSTIPIWTSLKSDYLFPLLGNLLMFLLVANIFYFIGWIFYGLIWIAGKRKDFGKRKMVFFWIILIISFFITIYVCWVTSIFISILSK